MSGTADDGGTRGSQRRRGLPTWARVALGVAVSLTVITGVATALGWNSADAGSASTVAFAIVAVVALTRRRRGGSSSR